MVNSFTMDTSKFHTAPSADITGGAGTTNLLVPVACARVAALTVLRNSMAIVMGPTPPGTFHQHAEHGGGGGGQGGAETQRSGRL